MGQVILVNSTNISVVDKKLNTPAAGVHLFYSKNVVIHENSISGNYNRETILMFASENVSVKNNLLFRSKQGISVHYSTNCEIYENNLISLTDEGIILESSIDNLIEVKRRKHQLSKNNQVIRYDLKCILPPISLDK